MMMAGCEKQAENENTVNSMNSFDLNIQGFSDASGAKTHWSDAGLWWNEDGSDYLVINGVSFQVKKDVDGWKAISTDGVGPDNGNFYVAYPYNDGARYSNHIYGPITFSKTTVPLASVSNTNSLTLYPCCAVIKLNESKKISFTITEGQIATGGYIDTQSKTIINPTGTTNSIALKSYMQEADGYYYYVVPIVGERLVCSQIKFGTTSTTAASITLEKGKIYKVNNLSKCAFLIKN